MRKLSLITLGFALVAVSFSSCKKCKECSGEQIMDGQVVSTTDFGELCGDDLKAVDGKTISSETMGLTSEIKYTCK